MLLRICNTAVTPVPPQLVAEVLDTVSLCLRTYFALRGEEKEKEKEERRGEERWHLGSNGGVGWATRAHFVFSPYLF